MTIETTVNTTANMAKAEFTFLGQQEKAGNVLEPDDYRVRVTAIKPRTSY